MRDLFAIANLIQVYSKSKTIAQHLLQKWHHRMLFSNIGVVLDQGHYNITGQETPRITT